MLAGWKKQVFDVEVQKIKDRELVEKRKRELAKVKRRAKFVGTMKYGKTSAVIKGGKALYARSKRIRAERAAKPKSEDTGYWSVSEWKKRIKKNYGWK